MVGNLHLRDAEIRDLYVRRNKNEIREIPAVVFRVVLMGNGASGIRYLVFSDEVAHAPALARGQLSGESNTSCRQKMSV